MSSESKEPPNPITTFLSAQKKPMPQKEALLLKDAERKRKAYAKKTNLDWKEHDKQDK